jgi:hypothetical protein
MDSLFQSGIVIKDTSGGGLSYSFLNYKTFRHDLIEEDSSEDVNRVGLILPAKSTTIFTLKASGAFGNEADTCSILYTAKLYVVTHGRSALVSVSNAFSQQKNKRPQEDPSNSIEKEEVTGYIRLKDQVVDFSYKIEMKNGKLKPGGRFIYNGDTLDIKAVSEINKKGRAKKAGAAMMTPGIQLQKGETVRAALDILRDKKTIYIARQISNEEKMFACSLFFIMCSYSDNFF